MVFSQCSKPSYEYTVVSPSDYSFDESMSDYGSQGWQATSCRRATSSYGGSASYECVMVRERRFPR